MDAGESKESMINPNVIAQELLTRGSTLNDICNRINDTPEPRTMMGLKVIRGPLVISDSEENLLMRIIVEKEVSEDTIFEFVIDFGVDRVRVSFVERIDGAIESDQIANFVYNQYSTEMFISNAIQTFINQRYVHGVPFERVYARMPLRF